MMLGVSVLPIHFEAQHCWNHDLGNKMLMENGVDNVNKIWLSKLEMFITCSVIEQYTFIFSTEITDMDYFAQVEMFNYLI